LYTRSDLALDRPARLPPAWAFTRRFLRHYAAAGRTSATPVTFLLRQRVYGSGNKDKTSLLPALYRCADAGLAAKTRVITAAVLGIFDGSRYRCACLDAYWDALPYCCISLSPSSLPFACESRVATLSHRSFGFHVVTAPVSVAWHNAGFCLHAALKTSDGPPAPFTFSTRSLLRFPPRWNRTSTALPALPDSVSLPYARCCAGFCGIELVDTAGFWARFTLRYFMDDHSLAFSRNAYRLTHCLPRGRITHRWSVLSPCVRLEPFYHLVRSYFFELTRTHTTPALLHHAPPRTGRATPHRFLHRFTYRLPIYLLFALSCSCSIRVMHFHGPLCVGTFASHAGSFTFVTLLAFQTRYTGPLVRFFNILLTLDSLVVVLYAALYAFAALRLFSFPFVIRSACLASAFLRWTSHYFCFAASHGHRLLLAFTRSLGRYLICFRFYHSFTVGSYRTSGSFVRRIHRSLPHFAHTTVAFRTLHRLRFFSLRVAPFETRLVLVSRFGFSLWISTPFPARHLFPSSRSGLGLGRQPQNMPDRNADARICVRCTHHQRRNGCGTHL